MEYTLNNFIGDTLYVLEKQSFGILEFDIPRINSLSYEEAYKFRSTYCINDMEGDFEADFIKVTPYVIIGIVIGFKIGLVQVNKSLSKVRFAYMKKNGKFVWLKSKTVHYWHNYIELEKTN